MDIGILIVRILLLFIMILPGFILRKKDMLNGEVSKGLSNLVLYAAQPAMITASFLREFDSSILYNMLGVFVFALLTNGFNCVAVLFMFKKAPERKARVLRFAAAFSNSLFMGLPIVIGVFGPTAAIYASMYSFWFNVFAWSMGCMLYTNDKRYISPKKMFLNPASIAAVIGLALFLSGVEKYIPEVITESLDMLSGLVAPLSMIVVGIRLAEVEVKTAFKDKYLYMFSALRLFGGPIVAFLLLKIAELLFGYSNQMVSFMLIVLTATPTATMTTMFAEKFDGDAVYASKCVAINTIFSLVTMPLMALLTLI